MAENLEERGKQAYDAAKGYYREGLNCAECVFKSFLDQGEANLPPEVICLASGLGAGIGATRNTCGAVLGACLAMGTKIGRRDPLAKAEMADRVAELNAPDGIYAKFGDFIRAFEAEYSSVKCGDLTADFEDWHSRERKKHCQKIIARCAELAVQHALK